MKLISLFTLVLLSLGLATVQAQEGFRPLFNGKDLTGWDGNPELWSVEDGCITGKTNGPEHLTYNQFIIWRGGKVKNFELRIKAKVSASNTGIQYRSKELPENGKWSVGGYQCDIHPARPNNAMVYEERGRGILVQNGQSVVIDQVGSKWLVAERDMVSVETAEWNEYTVIAQGNHLIHKLNGQITIDLVDHEEKAMALEGLLAFQIHRGPAMVVQIKEVMLKELPDGGVIPFANTDIPNDAQKIEKPGPAAKKGQAKKGPAKDKGQGKGKAAPAKADAAAAKKAKRPRPAEVGPAIGENKATPVERIKAAKDFKVELLYSVPGGEQGSWVALCNDDKGRIYASDQYGDLYRFAPPAAGQALKQEDVQKVPVNIRAVNGMVFAFGSLYAGVNDYEQKAQSGLYRISDTDNDDQLDKVELLRAFDSKSDHGVHGVMPTPDGKALYLITGNNAVLTEGPIEGTPASSPVPKVWGDDHLLPRMPDGRGHNRHVLAPGGIVYRVSPDGKQFEIFASGFRNIYDGGVNSDGELFTYDADMEYDFNTPWYRPTRVNHVVSGGEYGWRNGAGKYPEFYPDNLPAAVNIGPGSPTGTTFGYGAKFPAKYQRAFYIMDWSWGKLYAVHLKEDGSSYTAVKEDFITGAPLPLTDAIVHPKDGAMYFAIGGRRVQSGLYRVTYTGSEDTSPIDLTPKVSAERALRHQLEAFHGKQDPKAITTAWPHLNSQDRFIRSAARVAIEHQPVAEWEAKVFSETDAGRQLEAILALAHVTGACPSHRPADAAVKTDVRDKMLAALLKLDWAKLTPEQHLSYVRFTQIILHRFGNPDQGTVDKLIAQLDPAYPSESFELNWLLTETLSYLQAPNTAAKGMALIAAADSQEPQMEIARSLRMLKAGWTPELRTAQLEWFLKAANYKGGSSFDKFIEFIRNDSLATFTEEEKTRHAELIAKKPERKSALENVGAMLAGRTPTMWTLDELSTAAESGLKNRDFDNGRKMFGAAACYACHRFGNAGGMNGPDLTGAGGRYSPHDLLDQILNPSKEINEQFAPIVATLNNGQVHIGVVVNLNGDNVTLNTDLTDPNQRVSVDRKEVKSLETSKVSPMPPMLLAMLKKEEILDLIAYVLSGGDKTNAMFKVQ
ncbi:putative heme-binding domain-containing protein [Prosthecobacter fusiformis]|uniref:Putative heme-binding domain-containing protein n=1 Tax=Prosthecobacter fusiformis TaxID=48464 RepID=A0A4R7RJK6_9BACT|nr:family 16 glycoside hydrolase [Prosthecobacter fusiformis]TDU64271.1 putative heme-binding domain-containing protein [Prosthecobacter fusiformis]